jgi:hypothetical protein
MPWELVVTSASGYLGGAAMIRLKRLKTYLAALSFEYPAKKIFLYDFHEQKWAEWVADQDVGIYPGQLTAATCNMCNPTA